MATSLHEGPTNQLDLLIRAGKDRELSSGASGKQERGCTEGGVPPLARSVLGARCPPQALGGRGEGGVNEVMEATNQEVITLESNLPRTRRCRSRGARRAAAAGGRGAGSGAGSRAAVKLGTRGGRVARFAPRRGTRK
jgi:hypothetical protein